MGEEKREKDGEKGYEVRDRRAFTPEGDLKTDAAGAPEPAQSPETGKAPETPRAAEAPPDTGSTRPPRPMDFGTFVLSLATAALFHLGDAHEEGKEPPPPNLPLARETIDIIEMLKEKTRGNLSKDEEGFVDGILFDLRMRYVSKTKSKAATP